MHPAIMYTVQSVEFPNVHFTCMLNGFDQIIDGTRSEQTQPDVKVIQGMIGYRLDKQVAVSRNNATQEQMIEQSANKHIEGNICCFSGKNQLKMR